MVDFQVLVASRSVLQAGEPLVKVGILGYQAGEGVAWEVFLLLNALKVELPPILFSGQLIREHIFSYRLYIGYTKVR